MLTEICCLCARPRTSRRFARSTCDQQDAAGRDQQQPQAIPILLPHLRHAGAAGGEKQGLLRKGFSRLRTHVAPMPQLPLAEFEAQL